MPVRKMVDTNILVFALIQDHPASEVCEKLLQNPKVEWYISGVTLFELSCFVENLWLQTE